MGQEIVCFVVMRCVTDPSVVPRLNGIVELEEVVEVEVD